MSTRHLKESKAGPALCGKTGRLRFICLSAMPIQSSAKLCRGCERAWKAQRVDQELTEPSVSITWSDGRVDGMQILFSTCQVCALPGSLGLKQADSQNVRAVAHRSERLAEPANRRSVTNNPAKKDSRPSSWIRSPVWEAVEEHQASQHHRNGQPESEGHAGVVAHHHHLTSYR